MPPIKVLVVDDSAVVRRIVTTALEADPGIDVVGIAHHGGEVVERARTLKPDIITMDVEMPHMDGISAVKALRRERLDMPVIMFSTLTSQGASATLDALAAGATDYIAKPTATTDISTVMTDLIAKIKGLRATPTSMRAPNAMRRPAGPVRRPRAVVIGSSTGGPAALATVLTGITRALPVPVIIVQHMPPLFTAQLATRLDRCGPSAVVEASDGEPLVPGRVYLAPGDRHLELAPAPMGARTRLTRSAPVNYCRPAVDVTFRSAATIYGGDLLAVMLTGMGADGREGTRAIVNAGGRSIVQDADTSVVWGMPGAVANAGLAHDVLPLNQVAPAIMAAVSP